ncbi:tudor domain-containing protein 7A [Orussus abietinus]|uniref:tudor domain-containing protein 7A n=1 Tax=Orussus abietinus TaxID=222816 RepID=UPI0006265A5D|nr:tudor domain-containing protein 7A [Orussus abietinus]XP_012284703.1 tudor domain-containing protein 7A [Orussus abietinus]XP_012284704.1 tudor domain-containing protein 7A [Orussus abietinus]XP_012284705.1 tudor domain-containing protein 7A [Orussus abietinus]
MDGVVSNLKACVVSAKGGISISHLNRDFKLLIGDNIPYRKLGFSTLESFLAEIPGIRVVKRGSDQFVEALPTAETAHITKMISRQKSAPKKPMRKLATANRRPAPSSYQFTPMSNAARSQHSRTMNDVKKNERLSNLTPLMSLPVTPPASVSPKPRFLTSNAEMLQRSPTKQMQSRWVPPPPVSLSQSKDIPKSIENHVNNMNGEKPKSPVEYPVRNHEPKNLQNGGLILQQPQKSRSSVNDRLLIKRATVPPPYPTQLVENGNHSTLPKPMVQQPPSLMLGKPIGPREELKYLVRSFNLSEPEYKCYQTTEKHGNKGTVVYCQVKVSGKSYMSYPQVARTYDEAEKYAAAEALKALKEEYEPLGNIAETTDRVLIRKRVITIINEHPSGVFIHQLPIYYKQKFSESLPENWLEIIKANPLVTVDKVADNSVILLRHTPCVKKVDEHVLQKEEKIQLKPIGPAIPGQLELPEEDFWIVLVTCTLSTMDIWVRIVGEEYSEQLEVIASEMEQYYAPLERSTVTSAVDVGSYYAVFQDDSWHRVECVEFDAASGKAAVFFIDHGDDDVFHCSKLYPLEKQFCLLPAQAFKVCLAGLAEFSECNNAVTHLEDVLLERTLHAEVVSREIFDDEPFIAVILHDTSGPEDVNLNPILSTRIMQQVLTPPKLDAEGQVTEVFISHVDENGDVYVQVKSESMTYLTTLLNQLINAGLSAEDLRRSTVTAIDTTEVYFAWCLQDQNWYRAKVVDISKTTNQVKMFLIDFGKYIMVGKKNLVCLQKLSDVLAIYPHQALKVRLHNIPPSIFSEKMVSRLTDLAPPSEPLLVKVVTPQSTDSPAVVELFKRIQPDNVLASINNTLILEPELIRTNGDGNNNTRVRKRLDRIMSRHGEGDSVACSLKPPRISNIGSYFDVHVTMAANPGNFTVQPYEDSVPLEAMMVQLQETCAAFKGPCPTSDSVKEGRLYAAKHSDGFWYRVCISNVINDTTVTVYFCDFGDVSVLTLDKLQPLKSQFMELPYQAIRARLVGIQPVNIDWSVEDCLRFHELVVERNFVSIVRESGPDKLSPADTLLGLTLIDVSGPEDVYIDKLLIEERRAVSA